METNQRPYHLVVFGASGFTGQFVAEEVAREQVASGQSSSLPWAVAGRSREKLQRVLERAALKLGKGARGGGAASGAAGLGSSAESVCHAGGRPWGSPGPAARPEEEARLEGDSTALFHSLNEIQK